MQNDFSIVLTDSPPPFPRRHGLGIGPQAYPGLSRCLLQLFKNSIFRRILAIPPAPALLDEFLIEIHAIGQEHVSKGACVLVVAVRLDGNLFAKGEVRGGVLGVVAVGLAFLRSGKKGVGSLSS